MSILFVLLMFLLIISARYFIESNIQPALEPEIVAEPQPPVVKRENGFAIPQDYCFHLGHTWVPQPQLNGNYSGPEGGLFEVSPDGYWETCLD